MIRNRSEGTRRAGEKGEGSVGRRRRKRGRTIKRRSRRRGKE